MNNVIQTQKMILTTSARTVLEKRYLKDATGMESPEELVWRVACNIAQAEKKYNPNILTEQIHQVAVTFYTMIAMLRFLPNSPTLMNAGRKLQQLSACFVLPIEDSMYSIFETLKNTALVHKTGGGTGFSFSRLRPANDIVGTTSGVSSGPISFMSIYDAATEHVKQGGTRRGANMGILRCDHPDVLAFIDCKRDKTKLTNFNLSVALTEQFMEALESGSSYPLVNPKSGEIVTELSAPMLFDKIVDAAWRDGEPGIVYIDRMNDCNPTPSVGKFEATNPCGEQPLLPYESCNLGSINLGKFVFNGQIDYAELRETIHSAVHFLDNVIDMNNYPLPEISEMTLSNRKIGLGVMGFADMLVSMGIPYNSDQAVDIASRISEFINKESKEASHNLARARGPFPNFSISTYNQNYPLRNATTTTIAPTGTISIIAGASGGIEPLFSLATVRNVMDNDRLFDVHPAFELELRHRGIYTDELMKTVSEQGDLEGIDEIPEDIRAKYVVARQISPEAHIRIQSAFQANTDNAVSKTINLPHHSTREDVKEAYLLAYRMGCKGITVYRDKSRENQVLTSGTGSQSLFTTNAKVDPEFHLTKKRPRPDFLSGMTKELSTGCGRLYVTLNSDKHGLFEVFNQMGKAGGCAASQTEAIGRLASIALRSGVSPEDIRKQLSGIQCHTPCGFGPNKIHSCADGVAQAITWYLENNQATGVFDPVPVSKPTRPLIQSSQLATIIRGACPDCGGQIVNTEGCGKCHSCGYSECG